MNRLRKRRGRMDPGKTSIYVVLFIAAAVITIFYVIKVIPVYRIKWALEEEMAQDIRRFASQGEVGIQDLLADYCKMQDLPVDPYENCKFEGEKCGKGTLTCSYFKDVNFIIFQKTYYMKAVVEMDKIPCDSY